MVRVRQEAISFVIAQYAHVGMSLFSHREWINLQRDLRNELYLNSTFKGCFSFVCLRILTNQELQSTAKEKFPISHVPHIGFLSS